MKAFLTTVCFLLGIFQAFANTEANTCQPQQPLCQPCNSCCNSGQNTAGSCYSCREAVNMAAIEEMIERRVRENMLTDTKTCSGVSLDSVRSETPVGVRRVFDTNIPGLGQKEVLCDETTDGGDWIIFQRRMDGSVDFFRYWDDYVNGFGNIKGEFWLGLEAIHQLTRNGSFEMRIDMIEVDGTYYYAKYSSFKIEPASDNYRLRANGYSGNATDSFANPNNPYTPANNMAFSTRDQDHDLWARSCGDVYKGGWWYNSCHWVNLNGLYDERNNEGMRWWYQTGRKDLFMNFTEMKFRSKQ